MEVVPSAPRC